MTTAWTVFFTSMGLLAASAAEPAATITVDAGRPGARIDPAMWGIFFEDINFGADGGVYAELVKNRSFEFPQRMMGWTQVQFKGAYGRVEVLDRDPAIPDNPNYLRIVRETPGLGFGIENGGFRGIGVKAGEDYRFSAFLRAPAGAFTARVELVAADHRILAGENLAGLDTAWKRREITLRPSATDPSARLRITLLQPGTLDLDHVSLFPAKTWKNRPAGLRADLVQLLADLKPGFVRFPGGCVVEGHYLDYRYPWKKSIGAPESRPFLLNRWNDEFPHRPTPDYFQSFSLGFFEFFQLSEDIGAEPLPIVNCGMACQFNSKQLAPMDQLDPFIQDALDLVEFANGPAESRWGSRRAAMGHPAPFGLKRIGIGNEQWGPQYIERYERFARVLREKHPDLMLVSSSGPSPNGTDFDFAWGKLRELKADIVDEHYYAPPAWFLDNARRYDGYDRNGPKVFAGEYAAQSKSTCSPENRNNWACALSEAAFMTGLERNADVVRMASYAPLFAHVDAWQWRPNLIWFDNLRSFPTPNYRVQQLFSLNRGDVALPVSVQGGPSDNGKPRLYASAVRDEKAGHLVLKVVNAFAETAKVRVRLAGATGVAAGGNATVLAARPEDENTLDQPDKVAPVITALAAPGAEFEREFPAWSVTVLRLPAR